MCWFYYQLEAETLPFLGIIEMCNLVCIFLKHNEPDIKPFMPATHKSDIENMSDHD